MSWIATRTLAMATGLLALASLQASAAAPRPGDRVRCDSIDGRWNQCPLAFDGDVRLVRQLSRNACIRNQSWGRDAQGVWVSRGCRAEFAPLSTGEVGDASVAPGKKRIRCESRGGGRQHCPVETGGGVVLLRTLSRTPCELGQSWGFDTEGVWVSRGCRAEFELAVPVPGTAGGVGFFKRLFGREHAAANLGGGRPVRCESIDGVATECPIGEASRVEMVRQISHAACQPDRSWGWGQGKLWVKRGCRAEFLVW